MYKRGLVVSYQLEKLYEVGLRQNWAYHSGLSILFGRIFKHSGKRWIET